MMKRVKVVKRKLWCRFPVGGIFFVFFLSFSWAENILPNPSFEIWLDTIGIHMPFGWLTSEILRSGSAVKSSSAHTGQFCVNLLASDTIAFVTTTALVRPGASYLFSGWAKTQNPLPGSFTLQFLTILGNPIGNPILLPVYFSTNYREYRTWVTAPESAFFLVCALITAPNTNTFVDDVTLDDTSYHAITEGKKNFSLLPLLSSSSNLKFSLEKGENVSLAIYNLLGEEIRRVELGFLPPGSYQWQWDKKDNKGKKVPAGIYLLRLFTKERSWTGKIYLPE